MTESQLLKQAERPELRKREMVTKASWIEINGSGGEKKTEVTFTTKSLLFGLYCLEVFSKYSSAIGQTRGSGRC